MGSRLCSSGCCHRSHATAIYDESGGIDLHFPPREKIPGLYFHLPADHLIPREEDVRGQRIRELAEQIQLSSKELKAMDRRLTRLNERTTELKQHARAILDANNIRVQDPQNIELAIDLLLIDYEKEYHSTFIKQAIKRLSNPNSTFFKDFLKFLKELEPSIFD